MKWLPLAVRGGCVRIPEDVGRLVVLLLLATASYSLL